MRREALRRRPPRRFAMVATELAKADAETYGSAMLDSFKIDISHQEMERIIVELELILPNPARPVAAYPRASRSPQPPPRASPVPTHRPACAIQSLAA